MLVVERKSVKTKKPVLLTGFQTPGLIGVTAISQMINSLKMEEVAYLKSRFIPTTRLIVGLEFRTINHFRIYANPTGELLALINDDPTGMMGLSSFFKDIGKTLMDWFHKRDVRSVISLGSYPTQKREERGLVAYSTDPERLEELTKFGVKSLQQGFVGGIIIGIIDECIERGIPWLMLFAPVIKIGEVDIEGAMITIDILNEMLGLNIETESLRRAQASGEKKGFLSFLKRK
ncbi:MAG: proteasome assembly chaperone family protein [Candidatus Bathyarchaeia archaeon]